MTSQLEDGRRQQSTLTRKQESDKRVCECVLVEATKSLKVVPGNKSLLSISLSLFLTLSFSLCH